MTSLKAFDYLLAILCASFLFNWVFKAIAKKYEGSLIDKGYKEFEKRFNVVIFGMLSLVAVNQFGGYFTLVLTCLLSFLCFREFVSTIELKGSDYWPLLFTFYFSIPLQFLLVGLNLSFLFLVFLPVYAFLIGPMLATLGNDSDRFLERAAKFHWAQLICVYCVSYLPAIGLMTLAPTKQNATGLSSLIYLVLLIWICDLTQFVINSTLGKKQIAPLAAPRKTWEGVVGGILVATVFGVFARKLTPLPPLGALALSVSICSVGVLGSLIMSSVKRSLRIKIWGDILPGHGGMLDRFDSLIFAAPIYYHVLYQFYQAR